MKVERIIIADNQQLTALAVETIVTRLAGDQPVEVKYATNRQELSALLQQRKPTAVILDYTLFDFPANDNFLILTEACSKFVSWLLLVDELTPDFLRYVLGQTNTVGVAYKDASLGILREALRATLNSERYIATHATEVLLQTEMQEQKQETSDLTQTEREILKLIALGRTNKEIAAERFSSVHTINTHRKNIFRKLHVNCAHDAMKYAFRSGLVDQTEFYI